MKFVSINFNFQMKCFYESALGFTIATVLRSISVLWSTLPTRNLVPTWSLANSFNRARISVLTCLGKIGY